MIKQHMPWVIYFIALFFLIGVAINIFFKNNILDFFIHLYGATVCFFLLRSIWIELGEDDE
jgi:hypothetical protein